MAFLPGDQMRDQLAHRAAVGDEIVIDEIDRGRKPASAQLVEFRDDLLRPLHARHSPIEAGDIAELAREGAARGKLDRAEEIIFEAHQLIGRHRKLLERQALMRLKPDPAAWARRQMSIILWRWTCIPLTNTASAQAKSSSFAGSMFSSTNLTCHPAGTDAAMTSNPCGGMKARRLPVMS